jgi:Flp pilus assembly protein TadG
MRIRQRLHREDGAAAVEFALIVGVLVMLLFGMLQFGLTFFELQNLRSATREGGRLAAVQATPDGIRARIESASNGAILPGEAGNGSFVKITYSDSGTFTEPSSSQNLSGGTNPACTSTTPGAVTTDAAVRVQLFVAQAPPHLKSLFTVNIPLLPPITMAPTIDAQFRCEGVKSA